MRKKEKGKKNEGGKEKRKKRKEKREKKKGENNKYLIWEGKMRSGEAFQSGRKKGKGGRKDEKWGSFLIEGGKKGNGRKK